MLKPASWQIYKKVMCNKSSNILNINFHFVSRINLSSSVLDFGPQIKSNPNQIQILSDFDLDFKRFFMSGFGFGFDLKYCLKSKSNPNPFMKIFLRRCR